MNLYEIILREYNPAKVKYKKFIDEVTKWPVCVQNEVKLSSTVNSMSLSYQDGAYLLMADTSGNLTVKVLEEESIRYFQTTRGKSGRIHNSTLINCQWYPDDFGMICAAGSREIFIIATESFTTVDFYKMEAAVKQVYSTDWSPLETHLISVALSSSTVRIIDIRSGSSTQCLIIDSLLGAKDHSATRVKWDPNDSEAIYVGDSSGYIHVFDIRSPRKAVTSISHNSSVGQPVVELTFTPDTMTLVSIHGLWNNINTWRLKDRKLKHLNVHFDMPCSRKRRTSKIPVSGLIRCEAFINNDYIYTPVPEGSGDVYVNDINSGKFITEFMPEEFRPISARKVNSVVGLQSPYPEIYSAGKAFFRSWEMNRNFDDEKVVNEYNSSTRTVRDEHRDNWSDSD